MPGTILAVLDDVAEGSAFVRTALAIAERNDARLIIDLLTPGPLMVPQVAPFGVMYLPEQMLQASSEERVAKLKVLTDASPVDVEIRGLYDDVAWLAGDMRRARTIADLALIGARETWAIPYLYRRVAETLALASGGPLVILPAGRSLGAVRHAVFGWKPAPEAVRALHDLVAILSPGARVDVLSCGVAPSDLDNPRGHHGVVGYLERLGFVAQSVWQERQYDVALQMQTYALEVGADVLAVGAFAHSRWRELIFGGVTEGVIHEARIPVLLSR